MDDDKYCLPSGCSGEEGDDPESDIEDDPLNLSSTCLPSHPSTPLFLTPPSIIINVMLSFVLITHFCLA